MKRECNYCKVDEKEDIDYEKLTEPYPYVQNPQRIVYQQWQMWCWIYMGCVLVYVYEIILNIFKLCFQ